MVEACYVEVQINSLSSPKDWLLSLLRAPHMFNWIIISFVQVVFKLSAGTILQELEISAMRTVTLYYSGLS